jgi:hypothetical protein
METKTELLKVYKLTMFGGSALYLQDTKEILDTIEAEIPEIDVDGVTIEITFEMMTQEQYEALPEFDGW